MFDGMHGRRSIEFSRVRHRHIVEKRILVSGPADAQRRAGRAGEHGAARAAVLIEDDGKFAAKQIERRLSQTARMDQLGDRWISFEYRRETRLNQNVDSQIRAPGMQRGDGGSLQHQVAERTEPDNQNFGALRQ